MEEIREDLEGLRVQLAGDARILVLIDDLDRREPNQAVEVLQAINLLLNFSPFVVVLGIDARVVTRAIEKHYDGILNRAGASGFEYLEKIVQIPFRIPEPDRDAVELFLQDQLGIAVDKGPSQEPRLNQQAPRAPAADGGPQQTGPVLDAAQIDEFTKEETEAFAAITAYLRPNPRHLKRLVNVYRLVRAVAERRAEPVVIEAPARTIRWLALCAQWPYTMRAMLATLAELTDTADPVLKSERADALPYLLKKAQSRLSPEAQGRHDDDAVKLDAFLAIDGWTFTWKELETIQRYTINFNPAVDSELTDVVLGTPPPKNQPGAASKASRAR